MPWLKSCLSPRPSREKPIISPPLHLLLKPDGESQNHVFRAKVFKKPRPCHLCHQPIHQLGSCCRVCKYVCHKACESKYIKETQRSKAKTATLSSTINTSVNNNISTLPNNNSSSNNNSGSVGSVVKHGGRSGSNGSAARRARARSKDSMDLRYVTERIIALWVPGDASRAAYLQGQQQAASMLHTKHADNYMVFNLSAPRRSLRRHHHSVRELGWPRDLAPPLERLCSICKDMDSWLKGNSRRIAVVHARGSKDRIRVVVAAYMHYSQICGGADQALDRFAMKRFLQDQVDDVEQPSHRRYVDYFSGLLSGAIKINSAPLYLTHVTVLGAPSFEPSHPDGPDPGGGCRAFLKVYEGLVPVHTSAVYCVAEGARAFTVNVAAERGRRGLQLRGDVLVKCYHRHYSKKADPTDAVHNKEAREIVFACQFHSCAVSDYTLSFTRSELDYACDDLRFPLDGAVALHFSPTPEPRLPSPAPTPSVPTQDSSDDPVTRWDSYEHLAHLGGGSEEEDDDVTSEQDDDLSHTYGPLDGSLYATVGRKQQLQQLQQLHQQHIQMQQENPYRQRQLLLQQQQDHHLHLHQQRSRQLPQQHLHTPLSATSGASPGSEHTISMDSGISSAGNGGSAQTHSQRALDDLLSDMLLNVENFPDLKPASTPASTPAGRADLERAQRSGGEARNRRRAPTAAQAHSQSSLSAALQQSVPAPALAPAIASSCLSGATVVRMPSADTELGDIPYHARLDGRPFTYVSGASPPAMAPSGPTPNGLSSPSLVRRAAAHQNGYATSTPRPHNDNPAWTSPSPPPRYYDDLLLADGVGGLGGPAARGHLTWLQRQQQKLRERREGLLRSSRQPQEARLLSELRSLQHAHSASRRPDGYTSDTTTFADEDDEDLCRPLHINTGKLNGVVAGGLSAPGSPLQRRAAPPAQSALPYPLSRQKSDSSFDRERPFVAVKHTNKYHDSPADSNSSCVHATAAYDRTLASTLSNLNSHQHRQHNGHHSHLNGGIAVNGGITATNDDHNHYSSPRPLADVLPQSRVTASRALFHYQANGGVNGSVNGVGNGKLASAIGQPSIEDVLLSNGASPSDHHQDALACLMASLASPSNSPTSASPPVSMAPSPPIGADGAPSSPTPSPPQPPASARLCNASDCSTNSNASFAWHASQREESCSSWRSEEGRFSRPQTPAFPVQPRTPYSNNGYLDLAGLPPKSPTTQRKDRSPSPMSDAQSHATYMQHSPKSPVGANGGQSSPTVHSYSRRSSTHSNSEPPQEVAAHHVKFVRDTSRFWYKPNISREEAIALLRESPPGTFVVRDSNSFLGAFGLALRVSVPPATVAQKAAFFSGDASELVRHFLIEPTSRGVKLKGCTNEPVFSSLSALVYQHSIMAMALPCKLVLPDGELGGVGAVQARHVVDLGASPTSHSPQGPLNSTQQLLAQGAACNVLYLLTTDTESLTGPQAIRRVVHQLFSSRPLPSATVVHFKVSSQGITLTDNKRRLFFRRHYPVSTISHCGLDPDDHRWSQKSPDTGMPISSNRCFGFVARKPTSRSDNQCHIFAELEPEQPANAIVNFVVKVMMSGAGQRNNV